MLNSQNIEMDGIKQQKTTSGSISILSGKNSSLHQRIQTKQKKKKHCCLVF